MQIVYIAGPYRAETKEEVQKNIQMAEEAAKFVWKHGGMVVCPHKNSELFSGVCPEENFLKGYLKLLERCDAVLLVDGWERSEGTLIEIKQATAMGIPIFPPYRRESLARWLEHTMPMRQKATERLVNRERSNLPKSDDLPSSWEFYEDAGQETLRLDSLDKYGSSSGANLKSAPERSERDLDAKMWNALERKAFGRDIAEEKHTEQAEQQTVPLRQDIAPFVALCEEALEWADWAIAYFTYEAPCTEAPQKANEAREWKKKAQHAIKEAREGERGDAEENI